MDNFQQQIEIHSRLGSIISNMQNVAEDVKEIRNALPAIAERISALETEQKVRKGREALILWLASTAASGVGALGMWALTHFMG